MDKWAILHQEAQLAAIEERSYERPQLIFKHSTRCGISSQAQHVLDQATADLQGQVDLYYLDLIAYRSISNLVADRFGIPHQSPQVIVVKDGKVVHQASHFSIAPTKILEAV
ncbi:bacillithiol system redox-active protein YtxJ [Pontibacter sp. G13]|uniref:bacillithiol system redox-active protein YtxJ n=1 Tax=Pontibacter sp. G13 TaxID=3074898 RepID=UPI00288C36B3|nr:bacillithiol system redox-active protein YtxJ [Pontibacter sp. G13]WNJ16396.1 bacillithiol system redox-active protein YtxJ [Pontibacter sp. G13]